MTELELDVLSVLSMSPESTDLLVGMVLDETDSQVERSTLEAVLASLQERGMVSVSEAPGKMIAELDPNAPGANERWWELTALRRTQLRTRQWSSRAARPLPAVGVELRVGAEVEHAAAGGQVEHALGLQVTTVPAASGVLPDAVGGRRDRSVQRESERAPPAR